MVSQTEGKGYHDTKEMFDGVYALSKKINHQFRYFMLYLKVSNNFTNNYRSCQSFYPFIQLSLLNTTKEPTQLLNKKSDLINNVTYVLKTIV